MAIGTTGRRGPRTALLKFAAAVSAAVVLAACSSTTSTSTTSTGSSSPSSASSASSAVPSSAPTVDAATLSATAKKLFLTDVPVDSLNPVVKQALETAAQPWTDADQAKLIECLKTGVCETGKGTLTLAFPNDTINPWRQDFRAELTAQAIQSGQVSKIIYSLGTDVASWLANFKSLIAQKPDIIVMNSIYGPAILPAVQQAKAAGIVVVEAETPLPDSVKSVVDVEATSDLCSFYTQASKQVTGLVGKPGGYGLYTGVPGNASATAWQPCLKKGLEGQGWKKVIEGFTQWTPQGMTQQANALYASGKNPQVIAYDYTMEYFAAPFLKAKKTPPVMVSDAVNYAYLKQFKDAEDAGVDVKAFIANGRSWYGRIGVTAALMVKDGQQVDKHVDIPYPSANVSDILSAYDPTMPANAPVPTGFSASQMSAILAAGS